MEETGKSQIYVDEDEIDLYELCLVVKKRFKLILAIFIIAVLSTGVISSIMTPVYRSSFIVRVPTVSANSNEQIISIAETEKIINELRKLIEDGRTKDLSEKLGINENKIDELTSLTVEVPRNEKNFVEITADVYKPLLVNDLEKGILDYLNKNRYVKERVSLRRESLIRLKQDIQAKINEIEGLRDFVIGQIKKGKVKDLGFNPIDLDNAVINLKQRLNNIKNDIQLLRGFEVVIEPAIPQKPVKPKKLLNVAIAGITSLFFGIFLAFLMEWIEKNKRVGVRRDSSAEASE